jgi:hypothetical protein
LISLHTLRMFKHSWDRPAEAGQPRILFVDARPEGPTRLHILAVDSDYSLAKEPDDSKPTGFPPLSFRLSRPSFSGRRGGHCSDFVSRVNRFVSLFLGGRRVFSRGRVGELGGAMYLRFHPCQRQGVSFGPCGVPPPLPCSPAATLLAERHSKRLPIRVDRCITAPFRSARRHADGVRPLEAADSIFAAP